MSRTQALFLNTLSGVTVLADGGIGSRIFQMTGRLPSSEFVYETLNLRNSELIKGIHSSSLTASATVLTSNTFAANSTELTTASTGDQIHEITVRCEALPELRSRVSPPSRWERG